MGSQPVHLRRPCPVCQREKIATKGAQCCGKCSKQPGWHLPSEAQIMAAVEAAQPYIPDGPPPSTLFDERWDTLNKWIGRTAQLKARHATVPGRRDILHLADLHIPFLNEEAFARAVEQNKDCRTVVLGGDALNCGAASRFIESEFSHPREEMAQLTLVLQHLAETFEDVYCNVGNHPERIRKYFGSRIPPYMMFLVQANPIEFVIEGLRKERGTSNIHIAKPVVRDLESFTWMTLIGDVAFTHAETHSKIPMRPAENVAKFLRKWDRKLPTTPQVICQEHNHVGGRVYNDELGALLIQTPALSLDVNYQAESRIAYGPNQIGYTRVVIREDGCVDLNRSNCWLDFDAMRRAA